MANIIGIMGESGAGKTTSMRNLDPATTYYIDCDGKGLSWKGWRNQYNAEKKRNDIEIDFLISNNSKTKYKMYPIEVKSGTNYSIESLLRFREKYKTRIGECYIMHPRNLTTKDGILCIPPYMTICL